MVCTRSVGLLMPSLLAAALSMLLCPCNAQASDNRYEPPAAFDAVSESYVVNADGSYRVSNEYTLRILTPQGISSFGAVSISFASSREDIESIEASITQPDGTVKQVPPEAIRTQEESTDGGSTAFSDTKSKVILFPQVRVGSRLSWKYISVVHTPIFAGLFSRSYEFPSYMSTARYEVAITMPAGQPLFIETRGVKGGLDHHTATSDVYYFSYAHPESEAPPELAVSDFDDASVLRVSTLATPIEVASLYARHALPQAAVTDPIRQLASRVTAGLTSDTDRARALYQWVSKNIRYVAVVLGSGGYVPHAADEILAREYGDCKDHVTLLEALLSAVGIRSVPAIINSGDAFTLSSIGTLAPFNHVITYLPDLDLYVDSTAQFAPFGTLPFDDTDKPALLTSLGILGHTPRTTAKSNALDANMVLTIAPDGRIEGTSRAQMTGSYEIDSRSTRFEDRSTPQDQIARRLLSRAGETGSGSLENVDQDDLGTPYWIKSHFALDPTANMPGLGALKVPTGLGPGVLARLAAGKPSATPQQHSWPCISRTVHEHYSLEFPASVRITDIPSPVSYHENDVAYESSYRRSGRRVEVDRRLVVDRATNSCPAGEREKWRDFASILQRDLRAQIFYR